MQKINKWVIVFLGMLSVAAVITGCNCEEKTATSTGGQPAATNEAPAPPKDHPAH